MEKTATVLAVAVILSSMEVMNNGSPMQVVRWKKQQPPKRLL
ncbi:hypothetical protein [Microcoleus sp.]